MIVEAGLFKSLQAKITTGDQFNKEPSVADCSNEVPWDHCGYRFSYHDRK